MSPPPKRTPENDQTFFTAIENAHPIAAACRAAGYAVPSVYRWRQEDPSFAACWQQAAVMAGDLLEEEADRRGRDGIDEPVFYGGKQVGEKKRYSDRLLLGRLKVIRPEYRDGAQGAAAKPIVQHVLLRDFEMDYELYDLVKAGKLTLDDLSEPARKRVEDLQRNNAECERNALENARWRENRSKTHL